MSSMINGAKQAPLVHFLIFYATAIHASHSIGIELKWHTVRTLLMNAYSRNGVWLQRNQNSTVLFQAVISTANSRICHMLVPRASRIIWLLSMNAGKLRWLVLGRSTLFCLGVDLSSLCLGGHEKFYANCYCIRFLLRKHHLSQALLCL